MLLVMWTAGIAHAQGICRLVCPEQRRLQIRDPSSLPMARLPDLTNPPTVTDPRLDAPGQNLSLDEAIRTALANSEVVRVLTGIGASSSGRTIYDPAISNTEIDRERARFDPAIQVQNNFHRWQNPQGVFDPSAPSGVRIMGPATHDYNMSMDLSKTTITGATVGFGVDVVPSRNKALGSPLNPQTPTSLEFGVTQPLLQGGGLRANLAPVVISRIDTERSFFQMKDSVQQLVRGVIEGYWALVFAHVNLKVRRKQVKELQFDFDRVKAKFRIGSANLGNVAQIESALESFRAEISGAEADVLQREAALRNIMGLPPSAPLKIVPVTPPIEEQLEIDWAGVIGLAEERRPDLIELKLIIEADEQRLLMARNQALPRVDASALYRWNGLAGRTPSQTYIYADPGDFTEWQFGVNFSVPLGLRQSRAELRQQELIILRDRANLQQGFHNATHVLAQSYRNLWATWRFRKVKRCSSTTRSLPTWSSKREPSWRHIVYGSSKNALARSDRWVVCSAIATIPGTFDRGPTRTSTRALPSRPRRFSTLKSRPLGGRPDPAPIRPCCRHPRLSPAHRPSRRRTWSAFGSSGQDNQ
jgi:hypothetical protein